jgi:hypothetical protein
MIINYRQGWELPFHTSSGIGLEEVDLVIGDRHRTTPLMIAVQKRHDTVVKKLTSQSALQHHPNVAVALRCIYIYKLKMLECFGLFCLFELSSSLWVDVFFLTMWEGQKTKTSSLTSSHCMQFSHSTL